MPDAFLEEKSETGRQAGFTGLFRALRHRNYRLFFTGQGISLIGTWMQQLAVSWVVTRLTRSPFYLGVVMFATQFPAFLVSPVAGVVADRFDRFKLLFVTQVLSMLQALIFTLLSLLDTVYGGVFRVSHIVLLAVFTGFVNGFDMPVRQSFVIQMVEDKRDLPNAIALNSFMFNTARLVGPAVAGLVIAATGETWCFFFNTLSYVAVLVALMKMKLKPQPPSPKRKVLLELIEGLTYVRKFKPVAVLLVLMGLVSLAGIPYMVLLPVFVTEILKGGPDTLGYLMSASGFGAIAGAITVASRKTILGFGRNIALAVGLFGFSLILFSSTGTLVSAILFIIPAGFGMMVHMISTNTILQTIVDEDKRGRVMSFYVMSFVGLSPLGSLLGGMLASRFGVVATLRCGGIILLAGAILFARKLPELRKIVYPVYEKLGILPVASFASAAGSAVYGMEPGAGVNGKGVRVEEE